MYVTSNTIFWDLSCGLSLGMFHYLYGEFWSSEIQFLGENPMRKLCVKHLKRQWLRCHDLESEFIDIFVRGNSCFWKIVLNDECLKLYLKEKCSRNILQIWGYMTILEHCHGRKVMSLWVKEIIASIKRRKKAVQFQWVIIIISHAPWILHVLCVCV